MLEHLASFNLENWQWAVVALSALIIGFAKTGIGGVGILAIPLMASVFGGKASVGILLPMLCMGDCFAVKYYHRHAEWSHVLRLLPWALVGIGIGLWTGKEVSDEWFNRLIAFSVLGGLIIMIVRSRTSEETTVPTQWWFGALLGLAAGFTTMVGNAAGAIMAVYLLSMQLPKLSFIGTGAWYFLILNFLKVPLHVVFWGTITWTTFAVDLAMLPVITVGALLGIYAVKRIPERPFRIAILALTAVAAAKLLVM